MYEVLVLFLSVIAIVLAAYIFYLKRERGILLREISDEILGSSNGTANQSFSFKKNSIICVSVWVKETFVDDKEIARLKEEKAIKFTDKGDVWVKWHHVEDFSKSDENSRSYVVTIDEDGNTWIQFGDGKQGKRPPAGLDNICASYRCGC